MKTLADLKRAVKVGRKIRTISPAGKETVRTIDRVQSNGFTMDGCWLDFPRKALVEFLGDNKFNVYYAKRVILPYGSVDYDQDRKGDLLNTYQLL